jgi:hypothetical protein
MKMRHVFSTPDLDVARSAMDAARAAGIDDEDILLVARSDIELDSIPGERKEADTHFMAGAVRGAGWGAVAGLIVGLAMYATAIEWHWYGVIGAAFAGALIGAFGAALAGSSLPDPIRVKFDDEIKAGHILVIVDGSSELLRAAEPSITRTGARPLPFDASKAMS